MDSLVLQTPTYHVATKDRHKAPTRPHLIPLSLQDAGPLAASYDPFCLSKIIRMAGPLAAPRYPIRLAKIIGMKPFFITLLVEYQAAGDDDEQGHGDGDQ